MSRILVLGKAGQIGHELLSSLAGLGEVVGVGRQQADLSNADSIRQAVREIQPSLIVNAAAYTAVDQAESEPELVMEVNGTAPGIIAEEAKRIGAVLIHYSTDYVFDGTKTTPYNEEDQPRPLNAYGSAKLAGERAIQAVGAPHLLLRTGWVYGRRGNNFMLTMLRLAKERDEVRVVDDQFGSPTSSHAIAEATAEVLRRLDFGRPGFAAKAEDRSGLYHLTASGQTSWFGFAAAIFANAARPETVAAAFALEKAAKLEPITTEQYPVRTPRPRYAVLGNAKSQRVFDFAMSDWRDGLADCMSKHR